MAYIGKSPTRGVRQRYIYTATGSETSISASDTAKEATGKALSFTDGAYVDVYKNGALLEPNEAYNTNTTNTIAGLSSLSANDVIEVIVFDIFTTADAVSAVDGGTFAGAVTFDSRIIVDDTTQATTTTDGSIQTDGGLSVVKDIVVGDDILIGDNIALTSDASIIHFGAGSEVTLTHVHNTGLKLNSDNQLQFGDDGTYIYQSADGVLDLVADGELELNGALVDINSTNGNVDIGSTGGNVTLTGDVGTMTFTNNGNGDISLGNFKFDSDQTVGSGQDNYVLTYDHSTTKISLEAASGGGASNLNGLSDVTIASVANNDLIKYNSTAGEWQNTNLGLTVTPTLSVTSGDYYSDADSITISVTNHSSYDLPAYSVEVRRQDNNNLIFNMDSASGNTEAIDITTDELTPEGRPTGEIIINTGQSASNFDTITTDNFKILVLAQDFGDLQSEVATLNVSVVARPQVSFDGSTAYRYWRLADFDERIFLTNWKANSAINQGGTAYPGTEAIGTNEHPTDEHIQSWTSDGQTNVAKSNFAYSATYSTADPFNDGAQGYWTINDHSSSYWSTDNGFSAPSAYEDEQILLVWDMGTARTIKSMKFIFKDDYTNTVASGDNAFIIQGSNDESSWTTVCTVQESDQDFAAASGSTNVLVSDTS